MIASGSRGDGLRNVRVPTLVIHGLDDTLIAPSGGRRTAALVDSILDAAGVEDFTVDASDVSIALTAAKVIGAAGWPLQAP